MKKAIRFTAAWCGPCKQYEKHWKAVTESRSDWEYQVVDVDNDPALSSQYGIRSIPTTIFEVDGNIIERKGGLITESDLNKTLDSL